MNASRWRGALMALAIFVLGAAVGASGALVLGRRALRTAVASGQGVEGPLNRAANRVGSDLAKRLDLDREEAMRVQTELAVAAGRFRLLRMDTARQIRDELRATVLRIEAGLPEEKRAEFRKIVAERFDRVGVEATQPAPSPTEKKTTPK